jgi:hypothetical protein
MLSSSLLEKTRQYLDRQLSIEELEAWYGPRLRVFLNSPHSADAEVIAALELGLSEMASDIIDETAFRESLQNELKKHASVFHVISDTENMWVTTGSCSKRADTMPSRWATGAPIVVDEWS